MPIPVCETRRLILLSTALTSAVLAAQASAFAPFSGPMQAASVVPPNVLLLLDNTSIAATDPAGDAVLSGVGEAVKTLTDRHHELRFGLFGLRAPLAGESAPVGVLLAEAGSPDGDARRATMHRALTDLRPLAGGSSAALAAAWRGVADYLGDPLVSPQTLRCQHNLGLIVAGDQPEEEAAAIDLEEQAREAWQVDLRSGGADLAGSSWDDPAFAVQNLRTSTVALAAGGDYLQRAAASGAGEHVQVGDFPDLAGALTAALLSMTSVAGAVGGIDTGAGAVAVGADRVYQTRIDTADWSGSLRAYRIGEDGAPSGLLMDTDGSFLPGSPTGRFETWRRGEGGAAGVGVPLDSGTLSALSTVQQRLLEQEAQRAGLGREEGQRLLNWARGEADPDLRRRDRLLGDIVRSAPLVTGADHHALSATMVRGYDSYLARRLRRMPEAVIVGSNDGFVRLFDSEGGHLYSYLPAAAHRGLGARAHPGYAQGYQHRSGVDGRLAVGDVSLSGEWATVAAGGLGAGGRALFALRLFSESADIPQVLWERGADEIPGLGHVYGPPQFAQLGDRAVLILGNGYGSARGHASLLALDLLTGALLAELTVGGRDGAAHGNGLSAPVLQFDSSGTLRAAIAGDLHGQLWKFDLIGNDPAGWRVANAGTPLFTAAPGQPITSQPVLLPRFTGDGNLLMFGTGKLLEAGDLADTQVQAFYAVLDRPGTSAGLSPAALQKQRLHATVDPVTGQRLRVVDATPVDWSSRHGWYLPFDGVPGERVIHEAVVRHSRVMFPTTVAGVDTVDPCITHTGGWLMSLMLASGGLPPEATLDVTGDLRVDGDDVPAAGLELPDGLPGGLGLIELADASRLPGCAGERYLVPGSRELALLAGESRCSFERIMWRQLK